jgi:hypothetical protein
VVQLADPAVLSVARGSVRRGERVSVRVDGADVSAGRVDLAVVPAQA